MRESSHTRALSLVFALSIVVGGWLLFEYGNRSASQVSPATKLPSIQQEQRGQASFPGAASPPPLSQQVPGSVTYKCEKAGRVRFGDQPCGKDEKTLSVVSAPVTQPATFDPSVARMKATVAEMEAARLERDRRYTASNVSAFNAATNQAQTRDSRCQQIDREVADIDSRLRQPHSAQMGDFWSGKRKALMDERFSVGC